LLDDKILANPKDIQVRNGLPTSESLDSSDFTGEMETGTGKTCVYSCEIRQSSGGEKRA